MSMETNREKPETRPPHCPRCGYDQSGAMARWESSCDVAGTCPECGLHFDWADLLREDRARLPGFIEHPGHGGAWLGAVFLGRALRTWLWTLFPPRFFARVKMHHRFNLARMLLWLPALCAAMFLAAAACTFVGSAIYFSTGPAAAAIEQALNHTVNEVGLNIASFTPRWQLRMNLGRVRLPIYLLPAAAAWALVPVLLLALPVTRRRARVRTVHVLRAAVYGCAWIVPLFALRLINRAGMVVLVAADRWLFGSQRPLYVRTHWLGAVLPTWTDIAYGAAVALWLALWWWVAISRGMKLPHPRAVWAVTMGGAILVGFLVFLLDWRMVRFLG